MNTHINKAIDSKLLEVWIGLVQVTPMNGNQTISHFGGTFVNILASASHAEEYCSSVRLACSELQQNVVGIEDVEMFREWLENFEVDVEIIELAKVVEQTGEVRFSTYHTYP